MSKTITITIGGKTVISLTTVEEVNVSVSNGADLPWDRPTETPVEESLPLETFPDSTVVDRAAYDAEKGAITFDLFDGREYTVKAEEDDWRSLVSGASAGRLFNRLTRRKTNA
jgi:hypothetical protein